MDETMAEDAIVPSDRVEIVQGEFAGKVGTVTIRWCRDNACAVWLDGIGAKQFPAIYMKPISHGERK